jgi:hypothetical protein
MPMKSSQVDPQHSFPFTERCIEQPRALADAGVVHEYVEFSVHAPDVIDRTLPFLRRRYVKVSKDRVGSFIAQSGGQRVAFLVQHIGHHHCRAFGGKEPSLGCALAATGAGDQRNFAGETCHVPLPSYVGRIPYLDQARRQSTWLRPHGASICRDLYSPTLDVCFDSVPTPATRAASAMGRSEPINWSP